MTGPEGVRMQILQFPMLALFVLATTVHLNASLKQNTALRNKTKPFILVGLMGFYLGAADPVILSVVVALFFSWLGDMLLIPKGTKWFSAGGVAFMVSHAFFILSYVQDTDFAVIPAAVLILLPVAFIAASLIIFRCLRPHLPKGLFYPMLFYLILNGMMNCFAWFRALTVGGMAGIITAVGAFLFFVSDSSLFFVRFKKDSRLKTHFVVMLTYSLGEFLIILGLILR